ncbi:hypothetical protein NL444_27130, partial [Klebsiella pneumoniae]|nr:hypothetical protein [Klebsiella pneumoniae]
RTLEVEARGFGDLKVRGLLLRTDESEFEIAAQPADVHGKVRFFITIPEKTSQKFLKASSVVLQDGTRVPASNVVKVDFTDNHMEPNRT